MDRLDMLPPAEEVNGAIFAVGIGNKWIVHDLVIFKSFKVLSSESNRRPA